MKKLSALKNPHQLAKDHKWFTWIRKANPFQFWGITLGTLLAVIYGMIVDIELPWAYPIFGAAWYWLWTIMWKKLHQKNLNAYYEWNIRAIRDELN